MKKAEKIKYGVIISLVEFVMACSIVSGLPLQENNSETNITEGINNDSTSTIIPIMGEMVLIPAGTFQMGCDPKHNGGMECKFTELPLHKVYLDAYSIGKYEITNEQFAQCVSAGICKTNFMVDYSPANFPVESVSWEQADTYCTWIGMRLPTEAEWEKAARGNSDTRAFPWGDQSPDCTLANYTEICTGETVEVGGYPAGSSPYGVMDMAGNVEEWVNDWVIIMEVQIMRYNDKNFLNYYSYSPTNNPQGISSGITQFKGVRGGSYYRGDSRVAARSDEHFTSISGPIGFRCAESLGP
jgi:formylglycine-generating enzyme required for sulfatase activity